MPTAPVDLSDLGPLYHDYAFFGARGEQLPGHFGPNQQAKAPILTAYIALALADVLESEPAPSFVELFCADAYYAMVAGRLGAASTRGIDNNRDEHSDTAEEIARRLGIEGFELIEADVADMAAFEPADVVANVGGLYHVANPEQVLQDSYALATRYLRSCRPWSRSRTTTPTTSRRPPRAGTGARATTPSPSTRWSATRAGTCWRGTATSSPATVSPRTAAACTT
jgi:hypothetical protein